MASIPVIPGVKVVTKGVLNRPLKDIICAILFGGINNLLKGNILCIDANLEELAGVSATQGLKDAIAELRGELAALQEHTGITETLKRVNEAIADMQKVLALGGMCPVPLKAPKIPNVLNDVANSFFGGANSLINQLGRLAKPQLCLDAQGGVNTGSYHPDSILGQMNRTVKKIGNIPADAANKFERSLRGVSRAIRRSIDRELFPDFRHKHNLLTGAPVVAGAAALTVLDVRDAYNQAQTLVSAVNSTGSFPVQCVTSGTGAEATLAVGEAGEVTSVSLLGMSRKNLAQTSTTGSGQGAAFDVSGRLGEIYTVECVDGGNGYVVGDVITVGSAAFKIDSTSETPVPPESSTLTFSIKATNDSGTITEIDLDSITGSVSAEILAYDGYNSGIVKFVDKDTLEEIVLNTVTESFIGTPVLNAAGSITGVNVTDSGQGYQPGTAVRITGSIVRAEATPVGLENFRITDINLTKTGRNYRPEDTQIRFINPSTAQEIEIGAALLIPTFDSTDTALTGIVVVNGGAGYPAGASLRITNTRVNALAEATVAAGELSTISVTRTGTGYRPDRVAINFIDADTGETVQPLELPIVSPIIDALGDLTGIEIQDPGRGLPSNVTVQILRNDPATPATGSLQVDSQGRITSAVITNPGSGFRSSTVQVEIVNASGQPIVRQKAQFEANISSNGDLTGFVKISEGIGYPTNTQVEITDNFTSAVLTAVITDGAVTGFQIVQAGSGYVNPNIELQTSQGVPYLQRAFATTVLRNGMITGVEILESGQGYDPVQAAAIIIDESMQSCPEGVESQNLWLSALGPEVYSLAVQALTPQDPTFVRQEPVYDYCGRLLGYEEVVISGERDASDGADPLDGAVTELLDLNHEFIWIDSPEEDRVGWGVTGVESEQLVGAPGAKRMTMALDLNPEIVLYRGQSHVLSIPSGLAKEFYIYETQEDVNGRPVTLADGSTVKLRPDISKKFSQGLHRFETGEYLEDANGRNENTETWSGTDLQGDPIPEPEVWRRQDLFPEGSTLLFQIGEGDLSIAQKHWPDFLAYSNDDGTVFGLFRII
jgi:hypothetical protein